MEVVMRCTYRAVSLFVLLTTSLFLTPDARAGDVSGAITSDTTWTLSGSPVVILDSVTVTLGKTLTIEPGVVVRFNSGTTLVIAGKLVAAGTATNRIRFTSSLTSPLPGSWRNLTFLGSADVSSVVAYCLFEYGGSGTNGSTIFYATGAPAIRIAHTTVWLSGGHGINVRSSSPRISASIIRSNNGYGIYSDLVTSVIIDSSIINSNVHGGIRIPINSSPTVTYCDVDSNGIGIFIDNSSSPTVQRNNIRKNNIGIQFAGVGTTQPTISLNTITGNTTWGFLNTSISTTVLARNNYWGSDLGPYHPGLNPTGLGEKVSNNVDFQPWTILAPPLLVTPVTTISGSPVWETGVFWIKNSVSVAPGQTLTIRPGVIVKFAINARLTVSGTIIANGKADSLIIFTSERDDPYGGDTNGDGGTTIPARGNWDMVWLSGGGNDSSVLKHCVFRFGGSSGNGNVRVDGRTRAIFNSTFTQSSNYGLYLAGGAHDSIAHCTFGSNSLDGVLIQNSSPRFYNVKAVGNGRHGILANSGSISFNVRKSVFTGNSHGIVADAGSSGATLVSLDSSDISNNVHSGLYLWYGKGPQYFGHNRIANNGGEGLWCYNVDGLVTIENNSIMNNGREGIITSKAIIRNNVINGNRYPIALQGRVNSTYSNNTITGNTYNNVMALRINRWEESFSDTLKATVPAGMVPGNYVVIENNPGWGLVSGQTLVIQPGVVIKMDPGMYLRMEGTLIANASGGNPVVFTSYRDGSYGGKTNLGTDNAPPSPGDWRYIRIRTSSANSTILNNVVLKFGGMDGWGNLWFDATITLGTPVRNVVSRRSSNIGIRVGDGVMTFENATIDSNGTHGMYVEGNRPSNVAIRNSTVQDNGTGQGLRCADQSAFSEVLNCLIRRNGSWGIGVDNGTIPQTYSGNTITHNGAGGIWNNSPTLSANSLLIIGNTITDHPNEGVLSTRARFIDNRFERNRYPLAVWRALGNIYTDNNGVDGNIIANNVYNNAIAIWEGEIFDTLKATFPQAITSRTYVAIYDIQVNTGKTLVIEPGVRIKFQQIPTNNWQRFDVHGTLISEGTQANPIVFTSWRDSTAGGKTTAPNDFVPPAPGDWEFIAFRDGSENSRVRWTHFKFGGRHHDMTVYIYRNHGTMKFANNLVRRSSSAGIVIDNSPIVIDSTTVDSCGSYGIRLYDRVSGNLTLRHSRIVANGSHGILAQNQANISTISNCDISFNRANGAVTENNTLPLSVISNRINNNAEHGLYLIARNDALDTLLMIANNAIRNNQLTGLFSSRAYVVEDSITGNRYPIGVVGQISLASTGTANGNVYQGNVITGNLYNDILVTEESVFGLLGASFPPGYTKVVAVRGTLLVPGGTTLRIAPGTIIKFPREYIGGVAGGDGRFRVDGILLSEGTSTNKIVFTSWRDDSFGGDSNRDTTASVPAPGNWDMMYLNGSQNNSSKIFQTIVRYGGLSGNGNIRWDNNTAPMDSSFSSFSSNYGLYMNNASPSITSNEIHNNHTGILLQGSSNPTIFRNNIRDNSTYGLNNNTNNTINAVNNYWGASSGPFVNQGADQNLTGTGNRILLNPGAVSYRPFLTSRSGILLGDVSENGTISAYDAALILQHLVGIIALGPSQRAAADVSGDGSVSAFDASLILRYMVGSITGFPGAGKQSIDPLIVTAFDIRTDRPRDGEIEIALNLRKSVPIYATEMTIAFKSRWMTPLLISKTSLSDGMILESKIEDDTIRIAMAGAAAITDEGEVLRIAFRLSEEGKARGSTPFDIVKLILNEMDLTREIRQAGTNPERTTPTTFALDQNFPNPFNPVTRISYQLPTTSSVQLKIYDLLGREVRTLVFEEQKAGFYTVAWDGRSHSGEPLASGVYLYRLEAISKETSAFIQTKRMLLLK
jgi:parallel beta-helix repeat protein